MRWVHPQIRLPWLVTRLFPGAVFRVKTKEKQVYLTFDDGPIPEVTPWVLAFLREHGLKACFFCVGENVQRYPELFRQLQTEGHLVGNHTFNHMQGLKNDDELYYTNIEKAETYIPGKLFRPPHGLLRLRQFRKLKPDYRFIMWDIISRDFDRQLTPEQVAENVLRNLRPGSVIIFHDSLKAEENMKKALKMVVDKLPELGYRFGDPADLLRTEEN